jgi:1,4-alpha-glucan branching enzyme
MNDTLAYLAREPAHRKWHHREMTFGLLYAFSENFVLPLSHDEVVHGKGSLIGRIPGDAWQKAATLRAYFGFMWGHPGKKLLFMGQEFGQRREWDFRGELDWGLLEEPLHAGIRACVRDLNVAYRGVAALHARDCEAEGHRWVIADDAEHSVFAWLRFAPGGAPVLVVCNFTPVVRQGWRVGVPEVGRWREILNTDAAVYGGSGVGTLGEVVAVGEPAQGLPASVTLVLPPLGTVFFVFDPG